MKLALLQLLPFGFREGSTMVPRHKIAKSPFKRSWNQMFIMSPKLRIFYFDFDFFFIMLIMAFGFEYTL